MPRYIGCDHKRFVRLRVLSELAFTADMNTKSGMGCVVTEESKLWSNGHVITYSFVKFVSKSKFEVLPYPPPGDDGEMKFAIKAMQEYEKYANVKFEQVKDLKSAAIRISFKPNELWTTIGTDALMMSEDEATMNLAFIKPGTLIQGKTVDDVNTSIALHAFGHVLGLCHEMDAVEVPHGIRFVPPENIESRAQYIAQHFAFSHDQRSMSNFGEVDKQSIMKYLAYTAEGTDIDPDICLSLSDNDKAWLTLHYPKAELNRPVDAETWVFQKALGQLLGNSAKYGDILKAGDVSERRSIYLQFLHSKWYDRGVPLSDTVIDEIIIKEVEKALGEYKRSDKERLKKLTDRGDRLAWQLQAHTAPQTVPARMPDGKPLDAVQIQHSIHDFLHFIGRPAAPELQHFITHDPNAEQRKVMFNIAEASRDNLKSQLEKLEMVPDGDTNPDTIRKRHQIDAMEKILAEQKQPEQVQAVSQVGLDGLVRSMENSIPRDADVTGADVQHFFSLIPAVVEGAKMLGGILGLSINSDEVIGSSEGVQQGIFGDAWNIVKGLPYGDIIKTTTKIVEGVMG